MTKFGFFSYGHIRTNPKVPLNSVLLTNHAAFLGCKQFATDRNFDFVDLSPIIPNTGIDWTAMGKVKNIVPRLDFLYCQASCSLEVINKVKSVNPDCTVILQRDSTHAHEHLNLLKDAMAQHGHIYEHQYERNGSSLLNREVAEYAAADYIFVLSKWVKHTFDKHGLADKTVQFTSQCSDKALWYKPKLDWSMRSKDQFRAYFAGQIGLRKGIFDLLDAWTTFWKVHPDSMLFIAGLPEHGIPKAVKDVINTRLKATPGITYVGWCNMQAAATFYHQSHVFLMPSVEEGSTMCGVEAAMAGTPIIATENAGIDLLEPGVTGWHVTPGQPASLVQALNEAYSDRAQLKRFSEEIMKRGLQWDVPFYSESCRQTLHKLF